MVNASLADLIGFVGFRYEEPGRGPELLYGLAPDYWGQRLATEAAGAALGYAFERGVGKMWAPPIPRTRSR